MKYAVSLFGILIVLISGMLIFQYQVYSDKLESGDDDFSYSQEIDITFRDGKLYIQQHFHQLSNKKIKIIWPNLAVNPDCFIETENSCNRLSEDKTKFKVGESPNQSLTYVIPLKAGLTSNQLLKNIFVKLENGNVTYTTVHITNESKLKGQWITGLPFIGQQSLSLVNYSMFSGSGDLTELYWQTKSMNVQKISDVLTIYSNKPLDSELTKQLQELNFLSEDPITVVQGEKPSKQQGDRIIFVNDLTVSSINNEVLLTQVKTQYNFGDSPKWLSEVVASLLTETSIGSDKSVEIVNTLTNQMSKSQMENLKNELENLKGKDISSKTVDELISSILGKYTEYLAMNEAIDGVYPFFFNDSREVYINTKAYDDVHVIIKDGTELYSAESLLNHLGYKTKEGTNGFYVENASQKFRFPQDFDFYVFNEKRYDTVSHPITIFAGKHFIDETWLQRLFNVEVNKSETKITINATIGQQ